MTLVQQLPADHSGSITSITRRAIMDHFLLEKISWCGELDEVAFLSRLYDLKALSSYDGRFEDFAGDIWQHRVNNYDWDDNWVFTDDRLGLDKSDEAFLRFLCETLHPVVQPDRDKVRVLAAGLNDHLRPDGWELVVKTTISGRPIFAPRRLLAGSSFTVKAARDMAITLDAEYLTQQITRLEAAVDTDPELAIGTAKEFVETVSKTILEERKVPYDRSWDFPKLVRAVLKELKLVPDQIPDQAKAADAIRLMLQNLATVSNAVAEIRNHFGTGHGKSVRTGTVRPRHARLAVGAAVTLAVFLFDTHREKQEP